MPERLAYKVTAVAEKLDCSRAKAYQLVQSGELESIKIGNDRRVTDTALKAYLEKQRKAAAR